MYHLKSLLFSILHLNPKCITQLAQERIHSAYNDIFIAQTKNNLVETDLSKSPYLKKKGMPLYLTFRAQNIWIQNTGYDRNIFEADVKEHLVN